jgi:hypothetical protein
MTGTYELEFFAEDDGTEPVLAWIPLSESCFASSATPTVTS